VDAINSAARNLGSIGVVLGATLDLSRYAITPEHLTRTPVLAPGFGEQGARIGDIRSIYGATTGNVVVNVARAALGAGPGGLRDELRRLSAELAGAVGR
jgi:orotidine-5'-phosphate decarboxylase